MKKFKDGKGRYWEVVISVDAIKRVKSALDCDLLRVVEGKLIEELISNPVLLCDVLFVLCEREAISLGVSDSEFGSSLFGDALESATTVLLEELIGFFPNAKRSILTKALGKFREMETRALSQASNRLDSPEFQAAMDLQLKSASASFGNSPAQSE